MWQAILAVVRSVLGKVLALTVLLVCLGVAVGMVTNGVLADRSYERARSQEASGYAARLNQELASQQALAEQLAVLVAAQPEVQKAFTARDRAALQSMLLPAFTRLKADYGMAQFQFHTPPATSFLRLHSPKKFGDDLSSFRFTVVTANAERRVVSGVEGGVAGLGVRAVTPVVHEGRHVGTVEFGTSLGKAFVDQLATRFETGAALFAPGEAGGLESLGSTLGEGFTPDAAALERASKGEPVITDGRRSGRPELFLYQPLRDYRGSTVGVVLLARDISALVAARDSIQNMGLRYGLGLLAVGLVIGAAISARISRSITRPVQRMNEVLGQVADGDFRVRASADGDPAVAEMAVKLNRTLDSTAAALLGMLDESARLADTVSDVQRAGAAMTSAAGTAAAQAETAAQAADQVSHSVRTAAAGSEQMTASIQSIAANAEEAAQVGERAVHRAETTNAQVGRLGDSSAQIGEVVQLISSIAEQTNLLALNATIEAARAGEMGKGFAVVAGEVKELAHQTASATEDISQRIEAIQSESSTAVEAIEGIGAVIHQVNEYQTTIATAVEEQSATTAEITRSVALAADGVRDIASSVASLVESTQLTTQAAADARRAADATAVHSARMRELVGGFRLR